MPQRISEATRYTVYFTPVTGGEQAHECRARDRQEAISDAIRCLGPGLTITRVVPGWPTKHTKKGNENI